MFCRLLSLTFLFLCTPGFAAPLSLRDVALYSLRHSPALNSAQRQTLIAEMESKNSTAAFLPTLDFTSTHGLQRTYPRTSSTEPWVSSFSFTLAETLYDNGESITRYKIANIQEEISRQQLARERDKLLLDVASAYFQHSLAKKNLEIQREQHDVLKRQVQLVKSSYEQGVKTRKDFLRFQTQLNRSDIDLLNSQNNVIRTELALKRILGVPLESAENFEFALDESRPEESKRTEWSIANHRDTQIARMQRQVSDLNTQIVYRKLWPELGLAASATYGSSDYLGPARAPIYANDKTSWSAYFTIKYNLFDFGVRRRNAEIAAERAAVEANESDAQILALREELDKLGLQLSQLRDSFRLSDELLRLERNNLALITSEYRQGKVQYLDYINSLQNFANAKSTYYSSLFDLRKALLAQQYHLGTLYDAIQAK